MFLLTVSLDTGATACWDVRGESTWLPNSPQEDFEGMVLMVLEVSLVFLDVVLVILGLVLVVVLVVEVQGKWMSFILPVTRKKPIQELQGRSRTIRSITGMIRRSSWTTVKKFLRLFKKV